MAVSCCLVVVVTRSLLDHAWPYWAMEVALENKNKIIFILLEEVPNLPDKLNSAILVMDTVKWPTWVTNRSLNKFYKSLQLKLPCVTVNEESAG